MGEGESPAYAPRIPYRLSITGTLWGFGLKGQPPGIFGPGFRQESALQADCYITESEKLSRPETGLITYRNLEHFQS